MKNNILLYLTIILNVIITSCDQCEECPVPTPTPPPHTQEKQYISKVLLVSADSTLHELEGYVWDSLHRLNACYNDFGFYRFDYDSMSLISKIEQCYPNDWALTYAYYLFTWNDNSQIKTIEYFFDNYKYQFDYIYDEQGNNVKIFLSSDDGNVNKLVNILWYNSNIAKIRIDDVTLLDNTLYDDKNSPFHECPQIIFISFVLESQIRFAYLPAQNNPINEGYHRFKYDYNENDYPVRMYYVLDNGEEKLCKVYEYEK